MVATVAGFCRAKALATAASGADFSGRAGGCFNEPGTHQK